MIGKFVVIDTLNNFKSKLSSIPSSAIVLIKDVGQIYAHGTYFGAQKTYELLNLEAAGLAPAGGINANGLISNVESEWVLTVTNGKNPVWKKLPANAFSNDSFELKAATTSDLGGIKVGSVYNGLFSTLAGKHYAVNVDNAGLAYVSVPWDFTDLNVKQTSTSLLNEDFSLLFSHTADDSTHTEGTRKASNLKFNPSTGTLTTTILKGNLDGSYINKLIGYSKASTKGSISTNDSLNTALGKLEYKADVAYDLVDASKPDSTTIDTLREVLNVLSGITDTLTIQGILGNYLPITGGTLKGNLYFESGENGIISVGNSTTLPGHIYRGIYETGGNVYDHYYNGKVTADYTYANLRVKSLSGFKVLRFGGDGSFTWNTYKVWHSGNDGHDSGLDADTLDGKHSSDFYDLTGGTYISANTNLNNCKNIGTYRCDSDNNAKTLLNCPITTAFTMIVYAPTGLKTLFIAQKIEAYGSSIQYKRIYNVNSGLWTQWLVYAPNFATYNAPTATTATTATTAKYLDYSSTSMLDDPASGMIGYAIVREGTDNVGDLPVASNANGILTIKSHPNANYHHQLAFTDSGFFYRNMCYKALDTTSKWKQIAFTDSTIQAANKLANTVKLWGLNFNGSSDVSGHLYISNNNAVNNYDSNNNSYRTLMISSANEFLIGHDSSQGGIPTYIHGKTVNLRYDGTKEGLILNQLGNVGIGITNPAHKLDVNGNIAGSKIYSKWFGGVNTTDGGLFGDASTLIGSGYSGAVVYSYGTAPIWFHTGTALRMLLDGNGNLGIGTATPSYKLQVAGTAYVEGTLLVGNDTSNNYMAFYGTTGDGAARFSHTYIGEHATGTNELSELILYKGNDYYNNGSGPDRIRHIAAQHVFQIYKQAFSGTFSNICTSTVPENILAINHSDITSYVSIIPYSNNNYNLGSSSAYWNTSYCNTNICNKLGIGVTPQHALHVKGNSLVEGIFTIKGTNSSFQQLILKNSYTDTVDWDTKIISDYYGSHVYDVDGFRHGLFITLGRENPFDNLYVMDYSNSPIARISKYHGHYFDGNFEVTETIKTKGLFINTSDATLKFYSGKVRDGYSDGNFCLQSCFDGADGLTSSYGSGNSYGIRNNLILLPRNGLVCIGIIPDPGNTNYKLYVEGNTYSNGYYKKDSSNDYVLLGGGGHKSIADLTLGDNTTEISKSLTVTLNWMDTGIKYNDIPSNGSYMVQVLVKANDSTGNMWDCYFTGMMSWFVSEGNKTNDDEADEIILHRSGHAYHNTIYLRTVMTSGGANSEGVKLLIASNTNIGKAYTYTFKFKRII